MPVPPMIAHLTPLRQDPGTLLPQTVWALDLGPEQRQRQMQRPFQVLPLGSPLPCTPSSPSYSSRPCAAP